MPAALPDRADGMDDIARPKPVAARKPGIAGGAAADLPAFLEKLGPGRAMDRAVHAAAAQQRAVGGVDDRVDGQFGDVPFDHFDSPGHASIVATIIPNL